MNMDMQNQITAEWHNTLNVKLIVGSKEIPILGDRLHAYLKGIENLMRKSSEDISELKDKLINIRQLCWDQYKSIREKKRLKTLVTFLRAINRLKTKKIWKLFNKKLLKCITDEAQFIRYCNDKIYDEFESIQKKTQTSQKIPNDDLPIDEKEIVKSFNKYFDNLVYRNRDPLIDNYYDIETEYFGDYHGDKECNQISFSENDSKENIKQFFDTLAASYKDNNDWYLNTDDPTIAVIDEYQINWLNIWEYVSNNTNISRENDTEIRNLATQCNRYNCQFLKIIQEHETIQDLIKQIESLQVDNKHSENSTNFVIANIGFVVEREEKLKFITFPVCIDNETNVGTMYDTFNNNYTKYICTGNGLFKRNTLVDSNLLKKQGLKDKPKSYGSAIYENTYYHSEQALYLSLENPFFLKKIVSKIIKRCPQIQKIHLVVLDFHSSRYMCEPCTKSTIYMQNSKNQFLQQLTAILKQAIGQNIIDQSRPLQLLTRVSADIPHPNKNNPKKKEDHLDRYAVITNPQNGKLICMDSRIINLDILNQGRNINFDEKLNKYTVIISGGANDKARTTCINVYNSVVLPIKQRAAIKIQQAYRKHLELKNLIPPLTSLALSAPTKATEDKTLVQQVMAPRK